MDNPASLYTVSADRAARIGLVAGVVAYAMWGVLPIYFKALIPVPATAIVAHRIVWSLGALVLIVTGLRRWPQVRSAFADRNSLRMLTLSAVLIGFNWLLYVYAINSGHILAGSLGYYLNPIANILLGRFLLKEPLTRLQWVAVALAGAGVSVLLSGAIDTLWISLALCLSFAFYGLIRKQVAADSLTGLTVETVLLFPLAAAWLVFAGASGQLIWGTGHMQLGLLIATGVISTAPLLLFTEAARRLPYSTVGMLQFIAPTLQFLIAVAVYDEPFTTAHMIAFGAIWSAVALYLAAIAGGRRRAALAA